MLISILTNPMTFQSLLTCLVSALLLGLLTALVFLHKSRHTASFALTLVLMPMAVAMVIMLVNGNVGTGVAVAGAFALVRFRSVPGTAREIAAIFCEMALGLAIGMGYVGIACLFFLLMAVATWILTALHFGEPAAQEKLLKITIPENFEYEGLFDDLFEKYTRDAKLIKVRTTNMGSLFELSYSVRMKTDAVPKAFLDAIRERNGNLNLSIGEFGNDNML